MLKMKTAKIEIVNGVEGRSIYLNETRIAGSKPWGGGEVIDLWHIKENNLFDALGYTPSEYPHKSVNINADNSKIVNIAIDGPSSAGKSTVAKALAKKFKYIYVDTGALYRAIAYYAINNNIDINNENDVSNMLENLTVNFRNEYSIQHVYANEEDITDKIRTPKISMAASDISKLPVVRNYLLDVQRNIAATNSVVMDGRDIGTVILPNADLKIFLTASVQERSLRRFAELIRKGEKVSYEEVVKDIEKRDYNDSHRDIAPLKQADDAILIDSTNLSVDVVTDMILRAFYIKI